MTSAASPSGGPDGTSPSGGVPVRTCVGCRVRGEVTGLLRVVAHGNTVVPDPRRRFPGRGAWLHPSLECLRLAERRRAFSRALRVGSALALSDVEQYLYRSTSQSTPGEEVSREP